LSAVHAACTGGSSGGRGTGLRCGDEAEDHRAVPDASTTTACVCVCVCVCV
jgi:hypothetical protein